MLQSLTQTFTALLNLKLVTIIMLCPVAQSVTCLGTDACLTSDPGVESSIRAQYHTFMEFDHEIISMVILLPSDSFKKGFVSYKRKCVQELLVYRLLKPAQEKVCQGELTVPP